MLPFPTPGDLPDPGIKSGSLVSPELTGGLFKVLLKNITLSSSIYIDYKNATCVQIKPQWLSQWHVSKMTPK